MKNITLISLIALAIAISHISCRKELPKPIKIATKETTQVSYQTAITGGVITEEEGLQVTEKGICYATTTKPTLNGPHVTSSTQANDFSITLTGLTPNTTYYVKAYATNSDGTYYGLQVSFKTIATIPTLTTIAVFSATSTTATCGGNIISDGGATVIARGVCWSTSQNPIVADNHSTDGYGTGSFISNLTGLTLYTTYYVRAYATNNIGTAYGNQMSFTNFPNCGTVTDVDDNTYNTVIIGTQCWMRENLKATRYSDGIAMVDGTGAGDIYENYTTKYYFDYGNSPTNTATYGKLYTWATVMNGAVGSDANPSGVQGSCPTGWHIPSNAEWYQLSDNLGGQGVAGGKMKEAGVTHWTNPNIGADNSSGFTALPGGNRDGNAFGGIGESGSYWSSSEHSTPYVWGCVVYYNQVYWYNWICDKYKGLSVRCIRD